MQTTSILLANLTLVIALTFLLWGISLILRNASIADVFWGTGFVAITWATLVLANETSGRAIVLLVLVTLWGGRLTCHLGWRNAGKGEDHRYAAMREKRPTRFWIWSLVFVFLLQGLLIWIVALPLQLSVLAPTPLNSLDAVAAALWCIGWLFESVGDWQLARFLARPENKGRVMQQGLWRYTRHPNYFGDFLVWWAFYLFALSAGGIGWTVISPLLMSFLLLRVSGVTLLEQDIEHRRPGYGEYVRRTSAFVPWPPRRAVDV